MRCPFCNNHDTIVKDSRTTDDFTTIKRRRSCVECGSRFTTFERVQLRDLTVIKKDGRRVPFDREKLIRSVSSAMHKHSLDSQKIERLVTSVVRQLELEGDVEVVSTHIGEMVMQSLYTVDPVAYIRFASIYQDFISAQNFIDCISTMQHSLTDDCEKEKEKSPSSPALVSSQHFIKES